MKSQISIVDAMYINLFTFCCLFFVTSNLLLRWWIFFVHAKRSCVQWTCGIQNFSCNTQKKCKEMKIVEKNVLLLLCGLFSHFCRIYNFFCEIYTMNISPFTSFIPRFFLPIFFIMEKCEIHVFGWCENKIKFDQKTADEKWTEKKSFVRWKNTQKKIRYNNTYASNWPPSCPYKHPPNPKKLRISIFLRLKLRPPCIVFIN